MCKYWTFLFPLFTLVFLILHQSFLDVNYQVFSIYILFTILMLYVKSTPQEYHNYGYFSIKKDGLTPPILFSIYSYFYSTKNDHYMFSNIQWSFYSTSLFNSFSSFCKRLLFIVSTDKIHFIFFQQSFLVNILARN